VYSFLRQVTAWPNKAEDQAGVVRSVPFSLEDKLKSVGATFIRAEGINTPFAIQSGELLLSLNRMNLVLFANCDRTLGSRLATTYTIPFQCCAFIHAEVSGAADAAAGNKLGRCIDAPDVCRAKMHGQADDGRCQLFLRA
jgi:hypothetical protein